MEISIIDNEQRQQFQATVDGELAFLEYRWHKGLLALMHTEVPKALEGKGLASALAKFAFEFAIAKKVQVLVYCPFVATYLKRHPEYNYLVHHSTAPE